MLKVIVEDNAIIDCLNLSKGIRSYKPWSEFKNFEPDLIIKDGAKINEIKFCRESNSIELIAENSIPVLDKKYQSGQDISYILKKDINIKEPIKARKIELFDRSKITNQAFCYYLDLHDSSHVDKLKNLIGHVNMSEKSSANDILCSSFSMKNDSKCKRVSVVNKSDEVVELHDKAEIESFGVFDGAKLYDEANLKKVTRAGLLEFYNSAKADLIETTEKLVLKDKSHVKSATANYFSIDDEASADDINADFAELKGKSVTKNLSVKNGAVIMSNASVSNINVTSENPQFIEFRGDAKLSGVIKFLGAKGVVKIHNDAKTKIDKSQVINGTIEYEVSRSTQKSTRQSEPVFKEEKLKGFAKIAGMKDLKEELRMDVIEPLIHSEKYAKYKMEPINGLLFYGPPGCGKTYFAEALGEELGRPMIYLDGGKVASSVMGESSQKITLAFNEALSKAPCILFIDEADSVAPNRDKLDGGSGGVDVSSQVSTLLTRLNNIGKKDVIVIFATNEPQNIDKAIKRTGRLDKKIYIGPPDSEARMEMFKMYSKDRHLDKDIKFDTIVEKTKGFASSDIKAIVDQAVKNAAREDSYVNIKHFMKAMTQIKSSLTDETIEEYKFKGEK